LDRHNNTSASRQQARRLVMATEAFEHTSASCSRARSRRQPAQTGWRKASVDSTVARKDGRAEALRHLERFTQARFSFADATQRIQPQLPR